MARNVSEQEIDALLGAQEAPRLAVVPRDFREPRRFPPNDLEALERLGQAAGAAAVEALRANVGVEITLDGVELRETTLDSAVQDPEARLVAAVAEGPTGPSVLTVDLAAAIGIAEAALGSEPVAPASAREPSPLERKLLERVLARTLESLLQPFQVASKESRFVPDRTTLAHDLAAVGDGRRVALGIEVTMGEAKVVLHAYLAGVKAPAPRATPATKDARKPALPTLLAPTHVELRAVVAQLEILLTDLLAIEPGDVIPLSLGPGDPIELHVEGDPRARARFGEHEGRLAVRITEVLRPPVHR